MHLPLTLALAATVVLACFAPTTGKDLPCNYINDQDMCRAKQCTWKNATSCTDPPMGYCVDSTCGEEPFCAEKVWLEETGRPNFSVKPEYYMFNGTCLPPLFRVVESWMCQCPKAADDAETSQLFAYWARNTGNEVGNVTVLDPETLQEGKVLASFPWHNLFGGISALDQKNKVWYVPTLTDSMQTPGVVHGLSLSTFAQTFEVKVPFIVNVLHVDSANQRLVVGGTLPGPAPEGTVPPIQFGIVKLGPNPVYEKMGEFPEGFAFLLAPGGSVTAMDADAGKLYAAMVNPLQQESGVMATVDLQTFQMKQQPLNTSYYVANGMYVHHGKLYGLLGNTDISNITMAVFDFPTATWNHLGVWPTHLGFVISGVVVSDSDTFYAIIGNGVQPPVSLAIGDKSSGKLKQIPKAFPDRDGVGYLQPDFLAVLEA